MSAAGGDRRFPIRFTRPWAWLLLACGLRRGSAYVDVKSNGEIRVRMGWAFRARLKKEHVVTAQPARPIWWAIGVHGLGGRWIVNGATRPMVSIVSQPPSRAYVLGFPVRLRELIVSVDDADGLVTALR